MPRIHTHYDNLKVARNAPFNVIRAAYKTLSQQYHPDLNSGRSEAERIMTLINLSYGVLSDPKKRESYDLSLVNLEEEAFNAEILRRQQELHRQSRAQGAYESPGNHGDRARAEPTQSSKSETRTNSNGPPHDRRTWRDYAKKLLPVVLGIIAFPAAIIFIARTISSHESVVPDNAQSELAVKAVPWQVAADKASQPLPQPSPPVNAVESPSQYERSLTAPNGAPWPTSAGYMEGYATFNNSGMSSVTVDNTGNDTDVFVKLVSAGGRGKVVRTVFIPAFQKFKVEKVDAGRYDVRYRDLDSGAISKSEPFTLVQTETEEGIRYSNISMTLYKVSNGNMQTYAIPENEF
jgi:hypothetical protein